METQKSHFNRNLLIVLVILYLLAIVGFNAYAWANEPEDMAQWWSRLLNSLIVSIPLIMLFGSIYVLATAWHERRTLGQVNPPLAKIIHWAPRIACIMIFFFISLFSLDVFEEQASPLELLGAFLMHNIPSIIGILLLILAWKRPAVGFWAFLIAAFLFAILFVRDIYALPNLVLFALPLLFISLLFYIDWKWLAPRVPQVGPVS